MRKEKLIKHTLKKKRTLKSNKGEDIKSSPYFYVIIQGVKGTLIKFL